MTLNTFEKRDHQVNLGSTRTCFKRITALKQQLKEWREKVFYTQFNLFPAKFDKTPSNSHTLKRGKNQNSIQTIHQAAGFSDTRKLPC